MRRQSRHDPLFRHGRACPAIHAFVQVSEAWIAGTSAGHDGVCCSAAQIAKVRPDRSRQCPRPSSIPRCSATFSPRRRCAACGRTRTGCRNISTSRRRWPGRKAGSASSRKEAAAEIVKHCDGKLIDMAKLKEATERIGYPVLPVVQQLVKLCKDGLGEWSHWGATTQDITDTATVLQIREALAIVEQDIGAHLRRARRAGEEIPRHADGRPQQSAAGGADHLRLQDGDHARRLRAPQAAAQRTEAARAGRRIRRRRRHAVLARQGRAESARTS